jgi:SAM-dependent methyltransferase
MRDTDVRADATRMPFRTASFALVIASHLLEHIRDDRAALGEIARVMAPGGRAIVAVPMLYDWRNHQTEEYPAPNPRADNHWRTYGRDLTGRIERSGLACVAVELASLVNEAQFAAYGLKPGAVFIADKPAAAGRALS